MTSSDQQRLDLAKRRAATLVSLIDLLGQPVDAATIQKAALVPLSPTAIQAAANLSHLAIANLDGVAAVLAGQAPAEVLAHFADVPWPAGTPDMSPAAQPRLALEPPDTGPEGQP
jgi:hypothetical protein